MFLLHRFFLLWVVLSASQNGPDSTRYSVALPVERRGNDSSAPSAGTPSVGSWCGCLTRLTRPATGWLRLRVRRATTARGQPSRPSSRRGGAWRPGSAKPPTQRQPPATCRRGGRPRTHTRTPFCPMVCAVADQEQRAPRSIRRPPHNPRGRAVPRSAPPIPLVGHTTKRRSPPSARRRPQKCNDHPGHPSIRMARTTGHLRSHLSRRGGGKPPAGHPTRRGSGPPRRHRCLHVAPTDEIKSCGASNGVHVAGVSGAEALWATTVVSRGR